MVVAAEHFKKVGLGIAERGGGPAIGVAFGLQGVPGLGSGENLFAFGFVSSYHVSNLCEIVSKASEKLDDFANRVFELRQRLKFTQDELAKTLGVSRNYVYMIEKGREPGKKFVEKFTKLEGSSESREPNPLVVREEPPSPRRNLHRGGIATAERLRLDAQTLRVMADRLDAEASEIEKLHGFA